jgi:hypothetical protein
MEMTNPTTTTSGVFAELFRNRNRGKLTPEEVAERLGEDNVTAVKEAMHKVFMADLLHMKVIDASWHYGVTARGRRIVQAVGLTGVTDQVIDAEYFDAITWKERRKW